MPARVLVVDDIPINVKLLEAKLTREYFDVVTASDGRSALEKAETTSPDVILLDVMMPEMSGFEVCRRLRESPETAHIPVVMVTALSDTCDRVRGLEAGADDFLTKPVNDLALFARIKSLARLKTTIDEWRRREETCDQFGVLSEEHLPIREDASSARVLLIEKSEALRDQIVASLAPDKPKITAAADSETAMALARDGGFDFVIVGTPEGEGAEGDPLRLCARLRSVEECRALPILILLEADEVERLAKGLELGANDYVVKPIDANELVARSRTQIRRKRYQDRLRASFERSLSLALVDSLTGLYNRRYADAHLTTMMQRMAEMGRPIGLFVIDIDLFKGVNDRYGHGVGDEVLREVAKRVSYGVRSFDMVARVGGEEFLVVLPEASPDILCEVAERSRDAIAARPLLVCDGAKRLEVTVSIGATLARVGEDTRESLLKRADMAMYRAKREGRNRVVVDIDGAGPAASELAAG